MNAIEVIVSVATGRKHIPFERCSCRRADSCMSHNHTILTIGKSDFQKIYCKTKVNKEDNVWIFIFIQCQCNPL